MSGQSRIGIERLSDLNQQQVLLFLTRITHQTLVRALSGLPRVDVERFVSKLNNRIKSLLLDDIEYSRPENPVALEAARAEVDTLIREFIADGAYPASLLDDR